MAFIAFLIAAQILTLAGWIWTGAYWRGVAYERGLRVSILTNENTQKRDHIEVLRKRLDQKDEAIVHAMKWLEPAQPAEEKVGE